MLQKILIAFSAGALGGSANVLFLVVAGAIGLPTLMSLELPSFAKAAFLYKQAFWGGLWALLLVLPVLPKHWLARVPFLTLLPAAVTLFIFFPLGTVDGKGPGVAGLNIGTLMPLYVLLADLSYALVTSKVYQLCERKQ